MYSIISRLTNVGLFKPKNLAKITLPTPYLCTLPRGQFWEQNKLIKNLLSKVGKISLLFPNFVQSYCPMAKKIGLTLKFKSQG